jgi:hypothetical protein
MYNYNYNKNNILEKNSQLGLYIFELLLKDNSNNIQIIRCIKKHTNGNIISQNNQIYYNNIKKYKLTIIDANLNLPSIIVKNNFNNLLDKNMHYNDSLRLEFNNISDFLELNYFIK